MELWNSWLASEWGPAISAAIALASALCMVLKSRSESPIVQAALDIVSVIALNRGRARMADDDRV